MNQIEINSIVQGKVIKIKPFGAIMLIDDRIQGLVHISNISHSHVKDINEHINVGDIIDVKVLSVDAEASRVSLSIKDLIEPPVKVPEKPREQSFTKKQEASAPLPATFEDKFKDWVKSSNERQASINKRNKRR